ncbi:MAG TPA: transporter substrate-binding domain-containing protein [Oligoflexus sp.]|uniref:substrate-binding periplasmic protein n=1 Tax=Oligoflexus sp. TaxID=1971216 RepID=UPI002D7F79D3|nr:transporter substrate-binding domain-containing protein [Oligoflexus sp.]HET9239434.1 transporter substrate-binding domain-containing protein [Oligoflexus sp.]
MIPQLYPWLLFFFTGSSVTAEGMPPRAPIEINFPDFPPYYFKDSQGRRQGITTDTLSQCLNAIKRPFIFVDLPIERMQISMQEGFIDIHTYSYSEARESFVDFGHQELFRTEYRPFVRADSNISITKPTDFDSLRLGHIIGLRYSPMFMKYVEERRKARTVDEAASTEQNFRKLLAGRIDAFVNAVEPALYAAQRLGLKDQVKVLDWVAHDGHYFTAVSKKSQHIPDRIAFLRELDACLAQMKKDGSFCAIYRSYGLACPDLPNRP